MVWQINRTETPDNPPASGALEEGQLSVGMADTPNPMLWVGVPTTIDPTGRRLVNGPEALFSTTVNGVVPAAGTAPVNAALQADGTWRLPGQGVTYVAGPPYTVLPTDDWVFLNAVSSTSTITLPDPALVPEGKKIRLTIFSFNLGNALTINSAGINNIYWYGSKVFWPQSNLTLTGGTTGAVSYQLLFMQRGTYWWVTNEGFPINEGAFAMAGLLPGPPAGIATNAALQADMTWRVPGTVFRQVGDSNYTALPQDDWVFLYVTAPSQSFTFTLPDVTLTPAGKQIRLLISFMQQGVGPYLGCSYTINSPSQIFMSTTHGDGTWTNVGSNQGITLQGPPVGPSRVSLFFIKTGTTWYMYNIDVPLLGTYLGGPIGVPGLLPGPPAGTPATAVLHADMTWY